MYYITNHNDQIIAADESLLKSLQVENIDDLIKKVLLEKIFFTKESSTEIQIGTETDTHSYTMNRVDLSSMLGGLNLIHLETIEEDALHTLTPDNTTQESLVSTKDTLLIDNDEDKELFDLNTKEDLPIKEAVASIDDDEELFDLSLPNEVSPSDTTDFTKTIDTAEISDSKLFDLTSPDTPTDIPDEITSSKEDISSQSDSLDTSPIIINITEVSEDIGISNEDYKTFLNDYIDTAISLEDELQSKDENERLSAVGTLTQLADVLQLPKVNSIINKISTSPENALPDLVESFYQTLSRLTTKEENSHSDTKISDNVTLDINEVNDKTFEEKIIPRQAIGGFGKIYLEDVKPIYFDFKLESAANDLSLPVELIEEFVHDFIEQGHIETKKMLQAYEEGDLDAIQKIGHLLKGASSNLRINALSDTLYDIQFCEDSNKLEGLIERYWAHFLSFEQQINMINK
ncbi:MAG TPA: Hpt domain-containing protein [Sulfurovum sp.]|nr:Hpt domain-containing protein [Sulfurovum sp.]